MSDPQPTPGGGEPTPDAGHTEEYPTLVGDYPAPESAAIPASDAADAEADEEWVPRTARGVRLAVPVAVLVAIVLVAGGFWGGVELEKHHDGGSGTSLASLASRFRAARAGSGGSGFAGFAGLGAGAFGSTSAAAGTISVVDGDTLYVLTSTGSLVKVTLGKSTTITRNAGAEPVDLRPGDNVTVQGTTAANGDVAASSIIATAPGVSAGGGGLGGGGAGSGATSTTAG